ncbi:MULTISPECIES: 4-hydroxythreonine-4-phosphate dehydrogenase PdxA [Pseudomonadota]|uniref:4-hydroxythreonine-4-phosphate dehydrogenase PdxA n=1 Tax=Pseudomonadota TaxID=1224 RepID=UPI003A8E82F6
MTFNVKPRLAVIPGDANGIGPELLVRLLSRSDIREKADVVVIGDKCLIDRGRKDTGLSIDLVAIENLPASWPKDAYPYIETAFFDADHINPGVVDAKAGVASLRTLDVALDLARDEKVDGILFMPFNKEAMIRGGMGHEDELHYMAEHIGHDGPVCEFNTMEGLWTSRVTSHIALASVAERISVERIVDAVRLIADALVANGVEQPRVGVAALNPHAGDGGNFGREEIDIIAPAVEKAKSLGLPVDGPWPADTIFLKAQAGELDAIVTMYHDQGQIAIKLLGFDRGVTVQGGLPIPVATPAHGTAYDISGQGRANVGAVLAAFEVVARMGSNRRQTRLAA